MATAAIEATKVDEVGNAKMVTTNAKLYRDGTLVCSVYTDCQNEFYGLRGRVLVVALDQDSRALGVSQLISCATRGGLLDIFTRSSGRETFTQKFSSNVGQRAVRLDIYQSDAEDMGSTKDRLKNLLEGAAEVSSVLGYKH